MKYKHLLATALCGVMSLGAWADEPFRLHRYDALQAVPPQENAIIFVGNSITNMHEWWEAFGDAQQIGGRGTSGGFSFEILSHLQSFIDAKPAKMFLMIGTNDVSAYGDPQTTAKNIRTIIRRVKAESPGTELYVQSILPRSNDNNGDSNWGTCNTLVRGYCEELGVPYVDLTTACAGIRSGGEWSYDGLHLTARSYAKWCNEVDEFVGVPTTYPTDVTSLPNEHFCGGSHGMRSTYFDFYDVKDGDVMIFGGETIHGGEWHELLRCDKVKNRGTGWGGTDGIGIGQLKDQVRISLEGKTGKPAKIFFHYGAESGNRDKAGYIAVIDKAKELAPEAAIYVTSVTPRNNDAYNTEAATWNATLQQIAQETGSTYVDFFTPMSADIPSYITQGYYVSGLGYAKMAEILGTYLQEEGARPQTMEEARALYNTRTLRDRIGASLNTLYAAADATDDADKKAELEGLIADLTSIIVRQDLTAEDVAEATGKINDYFTASLKFSTDDDVQWYRITSKRENRSMTPAGYSVDGVVVAADADSDGSDLWKLVKRADGDIDIVSYEGLYLNPDVTHNTAIKLVADSPAAGWSLSPSSHTGFPPFYNIYSKSGSKSAQLNQTGTAQYHAVYNWFGTVCPNTTDEGCSFRFYEYNGPVVESLTSWYTLDVVAYMGTGHAEVVTAINNGNTKVFASDTEYVQKNTWYYHIGVHNVAPAEPARSFFAVEGDLARSVKIAPISGHYILLNGTASRDGEFFSPVAQSTPAGSYNLPIVIWANNDIGCTTHMLLGKFGNNACKYLFTPVDIDQYDIYRVKMRGQTNANVLTNDPRLTINSTANLGFASVYNNGHFFLPKGTPVEVTNFTADASSGNSNPLITIADGVVTVDYTKDADRDSGITSISEAPRAGSAVYDLQGRRVATPSRGLYIIDGRKVIL